MLNDNYEKKSINNGLIISKNLMILKKKYPEIIDYYRGSGSV